MYYIIYLSAGTDWFSGKELEDLLAVSIQNNKRNHITGMLLYADGNFIQLLEGDENQVQQTFRKITADARHKDITELGHGNNDVRLFPEWNMGFKSIGAISNTPFKALLDEARKNSGGGDGKLAVNLLNAFIKSSKL